MKNCPYCNAQIEEEARFCLYCMSPLTPRTALKPAKQKKRWLLPAALILLVLLLAAGVFLLRLSPARETSGSRIDTAASTPAPTTAPTTSSTATPTAAPTVAPTATPTPTPTAAPSVAPTAMPTPTPTSLLVPTYSYRVSGGNAVITAVTASSGGVYVIPAALDGCPVVAVAETAFSEVAGTVKKIVLPASVTAVYGRAFRTCYELTDLYFCGETVSMADCALPAEDTRRHTITIHCSSTCENDAYRRYRNIASYDFGAVFDEWDESEGY